MIKPKKLLLSLTFT